MPYVKFVILVLLSGIIASILFVLLSERVPPEEPCEKGIVTAVKATPLNGTNGITYTIIFDDGTESTYLNRFVPRVGDSACLHFADNWSI